MELESKFGLILDCMKENGKMIYRMGGGDIYIQMEISMMDIGKMGNFMAKEDMYLKMDNTMENGMKTKKMERLLKKD